MNLLPVLAQAAAEADPSGYADKVLDFWKYAGTAAAILALMAGVGVIHYWKVILPREQAKTEDQRAEAKARTESHQKIGDAQVTLATAFAQQTDLVKDVKETMADGFAGVHRRLDGICRGGRPDPDPSGPPPRQGS